MREIDFLCRLNSTCISKLTSELNHILKFSYGIMGWSILIGGLFFIMMCGASNDKKKVKNEEDVNLATLFFLMCVIFCGIIFVCFWYNVDNLTEIFLYEKMETLPCY